jgi:hypothetical protein
MQQGAFCILNAQTLPIATAGLDQLQLWHHTNCNLTELIAINLIQLQLDTKQLQPDPTQLPPDANQLQLESTQLQQDV